MVLLVALTADRSARAGNKKFLLILLIVRHHPKEDVNNFPVLFIKMTNAVAIDVEMVGTGPKGSVSIPARIAIVDSNYTVLLDTFVKPRHPVTDFRTPHAGIKPGDMEGGIPYVEARQQVLRIISGKILVGHDLKHDLDVLELTHNNTRDTAIHYREKGYGGGNTPSLESLARDVLHIQMEERHNPVEDARMAMKLYNADKW
ncbi:hypothetical protein B566_EDAN009510 [Ephemera danica]|nr:hypothetical protein B566_EDAN009510 [Ephemera danica]